MAPEIVKGGSQGHDMVTCNFFLLMFTVMMIIATPVISFNSFDRKTTYLKTEIASFS